MAEKLKPKSSIPAHFALLAASAWIATGALYKLLDGSPMDLPGTVHEFADTSGLELNTIYVTAIGIELAIVTFALLKPKLGWLPVVAQYLAFIGILAMEMARGAESCGCMGSEAMPPVVMLCIDAALLLGLLVTRPWSSLTTKLLLPAPIALIAAVAVAYVPRLEHFDRNLSIDDIALPGGTGTSNSASNSSGNNDSSSNGDGSGGSQGATSGDSAADDPSNGSGYLVIDLEEFVGKNIADTDLAKLLGADCPTEGTVVLWRQSCDHCAEHLRELQQAENTALANGEFPESITLVRVPDDEAAAVVVDIKPEMVLGDLTLPQGYEYVVETPSELVLEGGVVLSADEGLHGE